MSTRVKTLSRLIHLYDEAKRFKETSLTPNALKTWAWELLRYCANEANGGPVEALVVHVVYINSGNSVDSYNSHS